MTAIFTDHAPVPVGPYSQACRSGRHVFMSGQIALDPVSGVLVGRDIGAQAARVLENLQEVCRAAGGSLHDIVRVGIYLTDIRHFRVVNEAMAERFLEPYPARSTVQVGALPLGALIEVDAIAVLPDDGSV